MCVRSANSEGEVRTVGSCSFCGAWKGLGVSQPESHTCCSPSTAGSREGRACVRKAAEKARRTPGAECWSARVDFLLVPGCAAFRLVYVWGDAERGFGLHEQGGVQAEGMGLFQIRDRLCRLSATLARGRELRGGAGLGLGLPAVSQPCATWWPPSSACSPGYFQMLFI